MKTIFFIFLLPIFGFSQSLHNLQQIGVKNGLSQGTVHTLLKDSDDFIWVGTQNGLNRFDAYEFRQFFHDSSDSLSLSNNFILTIFEDSQAQIWIGTYGGGISKFKK